MQTYRHNSILSNVTVVMDIWQILCVVDMSYQIIIKGAKLSLETSMAINACNNNRIEPQHTISFTFLTPKTFLFYLVATVLRLVTLKGNYQSVEPRYIAVQLIVCRGGKEDRIYPRITEAKEFK